MSPRAVVDSIALIQGANNSWGTGFLVRAEDGRWLVMTAYHVAEKGSLTVRFPATGFTSKAAIAEHEQIPLGNKVSDWAALACEIKIPEGPGEPAPIALDALANFPSSLDRFHTFGYPSLYGWPGEGGPLHGEIRETPGEGLQPYCVELRDRKVPDAKGISGGPCLVADVAVGLIKQARRDGDQTLAASLVLVPSQTIVDESRGAFALETDPELPYRFLIAEILEDVRTAAALGAMVRQLELPDAPFLAGLSEHALRLRVVRGLLVASPVKLVRALNAVMTTSDRIRRGARSILILRESMWLHAAIVRDALGLADHGGAAALEAGLEVTARQLLRRVSWLRGWGEHWHLPKYCITVTPAPGDVASVVTRVEDEIRTQVFGGGGDRAAIQKWSAKRRLFVMIFKTHPRPELCAALKDAFGDVRVVFFARPRGVAPPPTWWQTPMPFDDEGTWRDACLDGREELRLHVPELPSDEHLDKFD